MYFSYIEKYGHKFQTQRVSVLGTLNIPKNPFRRFKVGFGRFLEMSIGFTFEVETQLLVVKDLVYISKLNYELILIHIRILQRQINALITKIRLGLQPIPNS